MCAKLGCTLWNKNHFMKKINNIIFALLAFPFPFTANTDIFLVTTPILQNKVEEKVTVEIKSTSEKERNEILWLARVVYSETKDSAEMEKIAWVVRNRVESGRWGSSYKKVVLSPNQFSGFNSRDPQYYTNINLDYDTNNPIWQKALVIAKRVYNAEHEDRILKNSVQHFYSPEVAKNPFWAEDKEPVLVTYNDTGKQTFRFYAGIE